jgi:hypothetical protein
MFLSKGELHMTWLEKVINFFLKLFKFEKEKRVAKITLEDLNGKPIEFDLSDLIYIGYDDERDCIVLSISNKPPMYLPLTKGNVDFLRMISPYFKLKATNDPKVAVENIGNKPKFKF